MPPGFVLSKELKEEKDYRISEPVRRAQGYANTMVLELLDEIFRKSIDVNLIEPQIIVRETHIVKI